MGSLLGSAVGGILLAASLIGATLVAARLPFAAQAGVFDQLGFDAAELAQDLGTSNWAGSVQGVGMLLVGFLSVVAISLLFISRRGLGVAHMLRVLFSPFGFAATMVFVSLAFDSVSWPLVAEPAHNEKAFLVFQTVLNSNHFVLFILLAFPAAIASIFILAWPARRRFENSTTDAVAPPSTSQTEPEVIEK